MPTGTPPSAAYLELAKAAIDLLHANRQHIPSFRAGVFRDNVARHLPIGKNTVGDLMSGKISAEKRGAIEKAKHAKRGRHVHKLTVEQKAKMVSTVKEPDGWDIIDACRDIIRELNKRDPPMAVYIPLVIQELYERHAMETGEIILGRRRCPSRVTRQEEVVGSRLEPTAGCPLLVSKREVVFVQLSRSSIGDGFMVTLPSADNSYLPRFLDFFWPDALQREAEWLSRSHFTQTRTSRVAPFPAFLRLSATTMKSFSNK